MMKLTLIDKIKSKIRGTIDLDKLKKEGLVFGENFDTQYGVIIGPGHCWLIEIGNNVTIRKRLCWSSSCKNFLYGKLSKENRRRER